MYGSAWGADVGGMNLRLARILATAGLTIAAVAPAAEAATPKLTSAHAARACAGANRIPTASTVARVSHSTLCLLNAQRAGHGLRRLRASRSLNRSARRYARSMVTHRFFA